ncbi:MAG: hypothetical protein KAW17_07630 [Candidatus Eisenbacteria sp.]|nr:hypothetical protein [Candidatus Eisenbacteria bacterium]
MSASPRSIFVSAALIVLILCLGSCAKDATKPEPQPEPHARSTLMGTIEFFAQAHENEDIEAYTECLHPEYAFWFSEDDRDDPNWGWQDWIGTVEDVQVTAAMFEAESVRDIRMTLTNLITNPDSLGFYVGGETRSKHSFTYFWAIFAADIHVVEETQDQEIDRWVDGRAHIFLRPDPNESNLWTIWKIEDKGNEHKGTEDTSWSGIKALFRK